MACDRSKNSTALRMEVGKRKSFSPTVEEVECNGEIDPNEKHRKQVGLELIDSSFDVAMEQAFVPNQIGSAVAKQAIDRAQMKILS